MHHLKRPRPLLPACSFAPGSCLEIAFALAAPGVVKRCTGRGTRARLPKKNEPTSGSSALCTRKSFSLCAHDGKRGDQFSKKNVRSQNAKSAQETVQRGASRPRVAKRRQGARRAGRAKITEQCSPALFPSCSLPLRCDETLQRIDIAFIRVLGTPHFVKNLFSRCLRRGKGNDLRGRRQKKTLKDTWDCR